MIDCMKDQKQFWDEAHKKFILAEHSTQPTQFAKGTSAILTPGATILELGCGVGNDSIYFAEQGHQIIATDFSASLIEENRAKYNNPMLTFGQQDIAQPLNFLDGQFDAIYARLSLHYFTDEVTQKIFVELARVLKPGGKLCFMCKSTEDRLYGQGTEIEQDMYDMDGHVRHFFSESYARKLLMGLFSIDSLQTGQEEMYGKVSGFVKVFATKL